MVEALAVELVSEWVVALEVVAADELFHHDRACTERESGFNLKPATAETEPAVFPSCV